MVNTQNLKLWECFTSHSLIDRPIKGANQRKQRQEWWGQSLGGPEPAPESSLSPSPYSSLLPAVTSIPRQKWPQLLRMSHKIYKPSQNSANKKLCFRGWGTLRECPLQYSCLENPMDGGAWWAAVHGVAKSRTQPSVFTFTFHFHALEKEMATHSSVLAWRIPESGEPGGLPSVGSHRVDWSDAAAAALKYIYHHMQPR